MFRLMMVLAAAAVVVGCGSGSGTQSTPSPEAKTEGKTYKIVMVAKSSTNPVFQAAHEGAKQAAIDISKERKLDVQVDIRTPADEDAQQQANAITEAANSGADAILVSCLDANKLTPAINEAVDKGSIVMTFDSDDPQSKRFAFYGADDAQAGKQVMDELAKQTGGKANVAILAGNQTSPNLQKRTQGAKDAMKAYPNMKLVGVFFHKETPADAANEVKTAMQSNPEIDAWAMVGGWPLFTTTLLNDLDPAKVKVVAIDALPLQLPYIEKGIAPVLLAQPVYDWGYKSVGFIVDKLQGKPVEEINRMDLIQISKSNLGDWARKLKKWGLPNVDDKYTKL